jgi:hypothetical protein
MREESLDSVERAAQGAHELKDGDGIIDTGNATSDHDSVLDPAEIKLLLASARPGLERTLFEPYF